MSIKPSLSQDYSRRGVCVALAKNRNFLDRDGELSLDAGPFVKGLEYASRRVATVFGKPAPMFFKRAIDALSTPPRTS
jgi:ribonucleotide monophosphatase NagD (HAD superfamily)